MLLFPDTPERAARREKWERTPTRLDKCMDVTACVLTLREDVTLLVLVAQSGDREQLTTAAKRTRGSLDSTQAAVHELQRHWRLPGAA